MKRKLFHVLCLSALVYLALKASSAAAPVWSYALAVALAVYAGIVMREVAGFFQRIPKPTSGRRETYGATLVSEVRRDAFSEGAQPQVQDLQGADTEPELARAALGSGDSQDSAEAEAAVARATAEVPVAAAGGVR